MTVVRIIGIVVSNYEVMVIGAKNIYYLKSSINVKTLIKSYCV
jgi:hypothetical protein